ncbi:MAG: hypothetical protein ACK4KT_03290 [Thermaurantimonas sp.]
MGIFGSAEILPSCSLHVRVDQSSKKVSIHAEWKNLTSVEDTVWFYYMPEALAHPKSFFSNEQDEYQNTGLHFLRQKSVFTLPQFEELHHLVKHPTHAEVFGLVSAEGSVSFTYTLTLIHHPYPVSAWLSGGDILLQFFYPQPADIRKLSHFNNHLYLNLPPHSCNMTVEADANFTVLAPGHVTSRYLDSAVCWTVRADSIQHCNLLLTRTLVQLPSVRGSENIAVFSRIENISSLSIIPSEIKTIESYLIDEYNLTPLRHFTVVDFSGFENRMFPNGYVQPIRIPPVTGYLPAAIAGAYFDSFCAFNVYGDRWKNPVFFTSIAEFLKHEYIKKQHPEIKLAGPLANTWVGTLLGLQNLPYHYQNQLIYLFTERQGLSQPLSDAYPIASRLHIDGAGVAKYVSGLFHLKGYLGDLKFRKIFHQAFNSGKVNSPEDFHHFLAENHYTSLEWFTIGLYTKNEILDYAILGSKRCNYTQVVTVKNRGTMTAPIPISGIKDNKIFITQWYEGHRGVRKIPIHPEKFERIIIDAALITPEINHHNNQIRTHGLFRKVEPVRFQFYTGLEEPLKNQLYWLPVVGYNAYDQLLVGLSVYNNGLLLKKYEYLISPQFSTGTGKLTGTASLAANYPLYSGPLHMVRAGVFFKHFHYDRDLSFTRWSPTVRLWWRKSNPRSKTFHITRLRYVDVYRELSEDFGELPLEITNASYGVLSVGHTMEYTSILRPSIVKLSFESGNSFTKIFGEWDQRWMLRNKKWLIARIFYGQFLRNNIPVANAFYNFGMSGTLDYNFDYPFYGRSDSTGIWSQQMFVTDGGFRAATGLFAQRWMATASVSIPIWKFAGLYGDAGFSDGIFSYGLGVRLAFITDFFEVYCPLFSSHTRQGMPPGYLPTIRFLLNPDLNAVMQRLRRGWF